MQSKAFLNRGNISVSVKALNCKNWLFPHEIFLPFLQIWVEKKIYSTVILHYMIFLSRGEN